MYAMLTGKLPFLPDPPNNLTLLHTMILRGAQIPEALSDGSCFRNIKYFVFLSLTDTNNVSDRLLRV